MMIFLKGICTDITVSIATQFYYMGVLREVLVKLSKVDVKDFLEVKKLNKTLVFRG